MNVSPYTLRKRLKERGYLASVDTARSRLTVRKMLEGRRADVLHLKSWSLSGEKPAQSSQETDPTPSDGPLGPIPQQ